MTYSKSNDYTLCETTPIEGTDATLTRWFNFAACTVTTLYREKAQLSEKYKEYAGNGGYALAAAGSVALSSQMQVQKFSELDSLKEIEILHKELTTLGGHPPALDEILNTTTELRKDLRVGPPLQLKSPKP